MLRTRDRSRVPWCARSVAGEVTALLPFMEVHFEMAAHPERVSRTLQSRGIHLSMSTTCYANLSEKGFCLLQDVALLSIQLCSVTTAQQNNGGVSRNQ
jgi:hypothetical protein